MNAVAHRNHIRQTKASRIFDVCNTIFMLLLVAVTLYPFWYGLLLVFFCIPAVIKKFIQFFSDCNHLTHGIMVFRIECQTALPDGLIHIYIHGTEKAADQLLTASQNQHTDPVSHCAWSDGEVIIGGTASGSGFLLFSDFFF